MQRVGIFSLCAIVAVAMVWFLVRSGESGSTGERTGGITTASPSGSAASLDPAQPGPAPMQARAGSGDEPASGGGLASHGAADGSLTRSARIGSADAASEAAPPDAESVGQRAEHDSDAQTPLDPDAERAAPIDLGSQRQAPTAPDSQDSPETPEPSYGADGEGGEASASSRDAQAVDGGEALGVLEPQEIERRAEKAYPDGSLPPDELAKARTLEAAKILERSKIAAGLAR